MKCFIVLTVFLLACTTGTESSAQVSQDVQEAFDALVERGLAIGNGIDVATMIDRIPEGDQEAVELFLQAGINPNVKDDQGRLALIVAAEEGQVEIARILVEAGADLELTDAYGRTAEDLAYQRGHDNVVYALQTAFPKPPLWVVASPLNFEHAKVSFHSNLYAALEEAVIRFDGDLLVYFYHPEDRSSQQIEQLVFGDESVSEYIKANFATLAVEIGSYTWGQLMERYYPNNPREAPFVLLDIRRSFSHTAYHGWQNARESKDLANILQKLKFEKAAGRSM